MKADTLPVNKSSVCLTHSSDSINIYGQKKQRREKKERKRVGCTEERKEERKRKESRGKKRKHENKLLSPLTQNHLYEKFSFTWYDWGRDTLIKALLLN